MNNQNLENLKICINNARIELEQGGKYDWNEELAACDDYLGMALKYIDELV